MIQQRNDLTRQVEDKARPLQLKLSVYGICSKLSASHYSKVIKFAPVNFVEKVKLCLFTIIDQCRSIVTK